jgi:hypothetical protein
MYFVSLHLESDDIIKKRWCERPLAYNFLNALACQGYKDPRRVYVKDYYMCRLKLLRNAPLSFSLTYLLAC